MRGLIFMSIIKSIGRKALVGAVGRMRFNFYDAVGAYILVVALIVVAVLYYAEYKSSRNPTEPN